MGVTEKVGEFIETGGCSGPAAGPWRCGGIPPNSMAPLAVSAPACATVLPPSGAPLQLVAAAALWSPWVPAIPDEAGWKESTALKGKPKLAAAAQAAAAAWAAEVGSIFSLTMASSCFFRARLSLARRFWNQIFTWKKWKKGKLNWGNCVTFGCKVNYVWCVKFRFAKNARKNWMKSHSSFCKAR